MAYLCGECGTLMDVTKDFIPKSDLRELVVELKGVQDIYPGLHNVIAKIEKLIGGDAIEQDK